MEFLNSQVDRRTFLRRTALGAAGISAVGLWLKHLSPFSTRCLAGDGGGCPILPVGDLTQADFNGDNFHRAHSILWKKREYLSKKGGIPAVSDKTDVVVIGGGIAGLTAAFQIRDLKPLVLEQAPQFGGNAKGERWGSTSYALGSAYITPPVEGEPVHRFLKELGIDKSYRIDTTSVDWGHTHMAGKLLRGFWEGVTDPAHAQEFKRVYERFVEILEHSYPEIPWTPQSQITKAEFDRLDRMSFSEWMKKELGPLHPHVSEFLHEYCWSSCGGQAEELSAAQVLNFISSDIHSIAVFPGGNAAISDALQSKLFSELGSDRMRAGCFVVDVQVTAGGVQVCYETLEGQLKTVHARAAIIAAPKFVAKKWLDALPDAQAQAIDRLEYRAFLVANVLIDAPKPTPAYDVYRLQGKVSSDPASDSRKRPYTDIVFGSWAASDQVDHSVLTLYRTFPFDDGRKGLMPEGTYARIRSEIEATLPDLLTSLGYKPSWRALRLTRWGHALPLANVGRIADGVAERASTPIGGKVFFANQDNHVSPCFESGFKSAVAAAAAVRKVLG